MVNLVKNKKNEERKNSSERAVHAFQHSLLRLPYSGKRVETKQIAVGSVSLTGGLIVFPVSYIINDCVCEVWGYQKARLLIWTGFAMNFFFVALGAICDMIPAAPYWHNQEGFHAIFGLAPRIAAASFVAFIVGSFANAYVMSVMKIRDGGKRFSAVPSGVRWLARAATVSSSSLWHWVEWCLLPSCLS